MTATPETLTFKPKKSVALSGTTAGSTSRSMMRRCPKPSSRAACT